MTRHSKLRSFQADADIKIEKAWDDGAKVVLVSMPTGSGKTVLAADKAIRLAAKAGCIMAHRRELVTQISIAYASEGLVHDIIGQPKTIKQVRNAHLEEFGRQFIDPRAHWKVASVDTLINMDPRAHWFKAAEYVFIDEGHHVTKTNKWGAAYHMFQHPHKRGLLLSATPDRADGQGLGTDADGIVDVMIEGPGPRELIDQGYLTDYKVWCVNPSDLNLDNVHIGKDGDFIAEQMRKAVKSSNAIVGDVVATYLEHARGKLGVTFAASIDDCHRFCEAFNAAGVPAAVVTADTDEVTRRHILRDFKNRKLLQLINVDLFGEGFDLPAIECVSMARPTWSFALYAQQWGRALRLMLSKFLNAAWDTYSIPQRLQFIAESEKPFAMIFDHVGNVLRHRGPPDKYRTFTLNRRDRRTTISDDLIPQRVCLGCSQPYERSEIVCPYCGKEPPLPSNAARSSPHTVDGDLVLYSDELLKELRGEIKRIDLPALIPVALKGQPAEVAIFKRHTERQQTQQQLRETIACWAGANAEHSDRVNYRRFYHIFKVDVMTALTLNNADATALREKIEATI